MGLTVSQSFLRMKTKLEITKEDEDLAIRRREDIYVRLSKDLAVADRPILTGSFHRDTKTRPLKDVDLFAPLANNEENRRRFIQQHPRDVLEAFEASLKNRYERVSVGRRSVRVEFGPEESILSYDVVPAFLRSDGAFVIPDEQLGKWISSDPRIHRDLATEKNRACDGKWKPLIKMLKGWNRHIETRHGAKAIKPSFLMEVIALSVIEPPLNDYATELQFAFATLAEHVTSDWPDPSGLGPNVNEMDKDQRLRARELLREAQRTAESARQLAKVSDRQAILKWKELFGPLLPVDD
jgi:hypothetical protein